MYEDPCPNCGREGDPFMQVIAKVGTLVLVFVIVFGLLATLHIAL